MSTLTDRREHQIPGIRSRHVQITQGWRDFSAAIVFSVFGLAVTAAALIAGIPLFGVDIFSG